MLIWPDRSCISASVYKEPFCLSWTPCSSSPGSWLQRRCSPPSTTLCYAVNTRIPTRKLLRRGERPDGSRHLTPICRSREQSFILNRLRWMFSLHNSLTRLLTPKCPEKRETGHVWGFYPFRNSGFPGDIPTASLLCNPLSSGSSRVALLKYSSSSVQVLATLLGGIHLKVSCCSGPNDLVRMISVGAVWNWFSSCLSSSCCIRCLWLLRCVLTD